MSNSVIKNILKRRKQKPFVISNLEMHSMGESVFQYIEIKMHQLIREDVQKYQEIIVVGEYDRSCNISRYEKCGKLENWQRPTAEVYEDKLIIKCFPGRDYVKHYASLIASYFALKGQRHDYVSYILPTEKECWDAIYDLPLEVVGDSDVVILGAGLIGISDQDCIWQSSDNLLWTTEKDDEKSIAYLVFQFSFWGDILYRIVRRLAELGHKKIIFTAKLGGIHGGAIPNETLASGNLSYLNGEIVKWNNIFSKSKSSRLIFGNHINSPSVLFETKQWVKLFSNFSFVDPEVGYCAKASKEAYREYRYLHFVSNNLSKLHEEDLSNERSGAIIEKRAELNNEIKRIIKEVI